MARQKLVPKRKRRYRMKIPLKRYELKDLDEGWAQYYIVAPRTILEKELQEMIRATAPEGEKKDEKFAQADAGQEANLKLLLKVTEWNLDDSEGQPLPLVRDQKKRQDQVKLMGEIPLEIITWLAREIMASTKGPTEQTKGF